jgi:hypothetical protein
MNTQLLVDCLERPDDALKIITERNNDDIQYLLCIKTVKCKDGHDCSSIITALDLITQAQQHLISAGMQVTWPKAELNYVPPPEMTDHLPIRIIDDLAHTDEFDTSMPDFFSELDEDGPANTPTEEVEEVPQVKSESVPPPKPKLTKNPHPTANKKAAGK